jgi:hypothetical protein
MKSCLRMKEVIEHLAQKHGVDLEAEGAHFRLDMPSYERLCVEKIATRRVSVAHYFEMNGDLVPDPDIVFFTTDAGDWAPIGITQSFGGWRSYVKMTMDGEGIEAYDQARQADLADFAEIWAQNIEDQGWLERSTCTRSSAAMPQSQPPARWPEPTTEEPDMDTLFEWLLMDGDCEATDGCICEPDGVCPHGHPSWPLKLRLI